MRDMVDQVHEYMWAFSQRAQIDVDSVALRRSIGQHITGALLVVTPETLSRLGHVKLAIMIDTAVRYEITLAELFHEALQDGYDNSAALCRSVRSRRDATQRLQRRSHLHRIK